MTAIALADGSQLVLRWDCPTCLLTFAAPYCDCCGRTLYLKENDRGTALNLAGCAPPRTKEITDGE